MKTRNWINFLKRNNNALFILLTFSAALRIILFYTFVPVNEEELASFIFFDGSDAVGYNQMALNLINTATFTGNQSTFIFDFFPVDTVRPPGYPIFLALIYFLSGVSVRNIMFVQIIISVISILLVFKITWKLFKSKKVSLLAAFLFSIDIHFIYFTFQLYTETLFVFLLLLTVLCLIKTIEYFKTSYIVLTGICLGGLILIKPISIFLPLLISILILFKQHHQFFEKLKTVIIILAISVIISGFWIVRNKIIYGDYFLSTISSQSLYYYNCLYTERDKTGISAEDIHVKFYQNAIEKGVGKEETPQKNNQIYLYLGKEYVKQNTFRYIKMHFTGMVNMFLSTSHRGILEKARINSTQTNKKNLSPNLNRLLNTGNKTERIFGIYIASYLCLYYLLALIGILVLLKNKSYYKLVMLLALILYFTILTGAAGNPRLKLPVVPFYIILSAYGFISFFNIKMNFLSHKKTLSFL